MSERGRFVWYDLMTSDVSGALSFYPAVTGWTTQKWPGGSMDYTMWANAAGQPVGGTMPLPEEARAMGAPPHWLAYVSVPDLEGTLETAKSLGATILVPPTDIPDVGRFAVMQDPYGAVISPFTPAMDMPVTPPGQGDFMWHELLTSDLEGALAFYGKVFGWEKKDAMDMGPMGQYVMYGVPGSDWQQTTLGGMMTRPPDMPVSAFILYVRVPNLAEAVAKAKAAGATFTLEDMEVPGGAHIAQLFDPQGAYIALIEASSEIQE